MKSKMSEQQGQPTFSRATFLRSTGGILAGLAGGHLLRETPARAEGLSRAATAPERDHTYNIRAMGVVGDGSNETGAIQTILDQIYAAGGGTLFFPAGTYGVGPYLTLYPTIVLEGEGWTSVIQRLSNVPENMPLFYSTAQGQGSFGGARNLRFHNSEGGGRCLRWNDCDQVVVEHCWFSGSWGQTIKIVGGQNHLIAHCLRHPADPDPPDSFLSFEHVSGGRVLHNRVGNCYEGVDLNNNCHDILIDGNYFENIETTGVEVNSSRNVNIRGNIFINCNFSPTKPGAAIYIGGQNSGTGEPFETENIRVDGNIFTDTRWCCVLASGGTGSVRHLWIEGNSIQQKRSDYGGIAIKLARACSDIWIERNVIDGFDHGFRGIGSTGQTCARVTFVGNQVSNCRGEGLILSNLHAPLLRDNRVVDCGRLLSKSAIRIDPTTTGRVHISGGTISGSPRFGVQVTAGTPTTIMLDHVEFSNNQLGPLRTNTLDVIVRDCPGYITRASGTAIIGDGGSIPHGLSKTPTTVLLTAGTAGRHVAASSVTNSHIQVSMWDTAGTAVSTPERVYWIVEVPF